MFVHFSSSLSTRVFYLIWSCCFALSKKGQRLWCTPSAQETPKTRVPREIGSYRCISSSKSDRREDWTKTVHPAGSSQHQCKCNHLGAWSKSLLPSGCHVQLCRLSALYTRGLQRGKWELKSSLWFTHHALPPPTLSAGHPSEGWTAHF